MELLGLSMTDVPQLDEAGLRRAFRAKVRALHPDANGGEAVVQDDEEDEGIYALNHAYETVKKLL